MKQGFTMEAIATQLGVSKMTISNDLKEIVKSVDNQKHAKTASNPKGSGRRKGSTKPRETADKHAKIIALADACRTTSRKAVMAIARRALALVLLEFFAW
jgi:DeoR/GlpR family transcriptional regulator of sugar metabolism